MTRKHHGIVPARGIYRSNSDTTSEFKFCSLSADSECPRHDIYLGNGIPSHWVEIPLLGRQSRTVNSIAVKCQTIAKYIGHTGPIILIEIFARSAAGDIVTSFVENKWAAR